MTVFTIGVYDWDAERFVRALRDAGVSSLVDVRRRRGVRGAAHRFANATALERLMADAGIAYIAEPRLAPTPEMRLLQKAADVRARVSKNAREALSPAFVQAYRTDVLGAYTGEMLRSLIARAGDRPALLCVERDPRVCHRGILAAWMAEALGCSVVDLMP